MYDCCSASSGEELSGGAELELVEKESGLKSKELKDD